MINRDHRGFNQRIDRCEVHPWGIYVGRETDHAKFSYIETCLILELKPSIRVTRFHYRPGRQRNQDFYIDVGDYRQIGTKLWKSVDHYLDINLHTGRGAELLDEDELRAAYAARHLSRSDCEHAYRAAADTLESLAKHGYDLQRWLGSHGITVPWRTDFR